MRLPAGARVSIGGFGHAMLTRGQGGSVWRIATTVAAIVASLIVLAIFFLAVGANPIDAFKGMIDGSVAQAPAVGQTLLVTTPLILTAVAAAIPFSARIFNIGGDGQLVAGAVGATAMGFWFPHLPAPLIVVLAMLAGIVMGAIWGAIAGILRAVAQANEVIVTLMLNFVAFELADYAMTGSWADPTVPQTRALPGGVLLPNIWPGTAANIGIVLAVVAAAVAMVLMRYTRFGFGIRAVGLNQDAARLSGYSVNSVATVVLVIGGAFAGLAGAIEVVGVHQALVPNISPNYGFTGIAVALVAGLRPLWIIPVAFCFAAVTVGSNALPAVANVSSSSSLIVLAVLVLMLLGARVIRITYPELA